MSKTLLDSEGLKLYDQLIKEYIANNAGGGSSGGDSGDAIPKTGKRGFLGGSNDINIWDASGTYEIGANSCDDNFLMLSDGFGTMSETIINVSDGDGESPDSWTKTMFIMNFGNPVTLNLADGWMFAGASTLPEFGLVVFDWKGFQGVVYSKDLE